MTNTPWDTATFINTHFAPCYPGTCSVTTFFFHYSAGDQMLVDSIRQITNWHRFADAGMNACRRELM